MSSRTIHCPSCGGPTDVRSRSIQVVVCQYCDQSITLTPEGVEAQGGKSAALADLFTDLSTGAAGRLDGRTFQVAGRVRYTWDAGFWDEWILSFDDGTMAWLHEDEGELTLLVQVDLTGPVDLDGARVGKTIAVNGRQVYVTERRGARIHGGEGQIPRGVVFGGQLEYVDGKVQGESWMLERMNGTVELFVGKTVADDAIEVYGA